MSNLYLIRHGQANFGGADYDLLSPLGHQQSRTLGQYFVAQGIHFDAVYSGEKRRQQETAQATLEAMDKAEDVRILPAFNEFDAEAMLRSAIPQLMEEDPRLEKPSQPSYEIFRQLMSRVLGHWVAGTLKGMANLESWPAFQQRIKTGVSTLLREEGEGRRIAVFTSGGPISATLHALSATHPAGLNWDICNTSISCFSYRGTQLEDVLSTYETPHLPPDQITYI